MTKFAPIQPEPLGMIPPKPGEFIREEFVEPSGMTQQEVANRLGVSRQALSNLLHDKAELTPRMAARIEMVFRIRAETLLRLKAWSDATEAKRIKDSGELESLEPIAL